MPLVNIARVGFRASVERLLEAEGNHYLLKNPVEIQNNYPYLTFIRSNVFMCWVVVKK